MITLDDVVDYVWRNDYVLHDDDNVVYQLAELIYEQITTADPSLDELDKILEKIHDEARTDRCR